MLALDVTRLHSARRYVAGQWIRPAPALHSCNMMFNSIALDASFDPIDASESNLATMPPLICPTEATSTAIHTSTEERVETRTDREDRGETEIQREATEGNRCGHTPPAAATTPTTVSPTPATSVTQDPDLLILVLPTSVAIVLALLILIILLGVCICWRCSPAMWR